MRTPRMLLASFALAMLTGGGAVMATGGVVAAASPAGTSTATVVVLAAELKASEVVAGSSSTATGKAVVRIDTVNKTLTTDLKWSGLSGPADRAHVHSGLFGQPTDDHFFHEVISDAARTVVPCGWDQAVFSDCAPTTGSSHDVLDISAGYGDCTDIPCLVDMAVTAGWYLDMHTQLYPSGEIRGQLRFVVRRPDGRVRRAGTSGYAGNDVYNATGAHQLASATGGRGSTLAFDVSLQNDARYQDAYRVSVTGVISPGFKVTFFAGSKNVTAQVRAGTYVTKTIPAGYAVPLRIICHIEDTADRGAGVSQLLTITSEGDPTKVDAVKVKASRP